MPNRPGKFIWILYRFDSNGYMQEVQRWNKDQKPAYQPKLSERLQRQFIED